MSGKPSLGQSIVHAVKFLRQVHADIATMINELDEAMEKRGWMPTHKNRISEWLDNSLDPELWVQLWMLRLYAPSGKKAKATKRVLALVVHLLPPKTHDEVVCLIMAVRFPRPKAYSEIWHELDSGDGEPYGSDRLTEFLVGKVGTQSIPNKLLQKDLFPGAEIGVAFTVPLCSLTDVEALHNRVVTPLLEAEKLLNE